MNTLFALLGAPFLKLPFCSLPGAVVGSLTGCVMTSFMSEQAGNALTAQQLFVVGLLCAAVGFLLVLFLYGVLLRYGMGAMFLPGLVNALVTAVITVFVTYWLQIPALAAPVGLLLGILVGAILCWLCRTDARRSHAKA